MASLQDFASLQNPYPFDHTIYPTSPMTIFKSNPPLVVHIQSTFWGPVTHYYHDLVDYHGSITTIECIGRLPMSGQLRQRCGSEWAQEYIYHAAQPDVMLMSRVSDQVWELDFMSLVPYTLLNCVNAEPEVLSTRRSRPSQTSAAQDEEQWDSMTEAGSSTTADETDATMDDESDATVDMDVDNE